MAPETEENVLTWDDELMDWTWSRTCTLNEDNDAYLPFAMFATAYARRKLLTGVKACHESIPDCVIHSDTDSIIHYGPVCETIGIGDHLGTWGIESRPAVIIEGGFKRYMELARFPIQEQGDIIGCAIAGVPQHTDDNGVPTGMWVEILDDPELLLEDGAVLGDLHYRIKSPWLRRLYDENGLDPDDVDTMKLLPRTVPGGTILTPHHHQLNDNIQWRLRR